MRRGFTLVELIAVLAILAILAVFLVTQIGSAEEVVQQKLCATRLRQVAAALAHYESETGDYPPSSFGGAAGEAPNAVNVGGERLVLALFSEGRDGCGLSPDELGNSDGDRSAAAASDLPTTELFELLDPWGNPIAYFHHTDYGRADVYRAVDPATGEEREAPVSARKNARTGLFYEHRRFQLLSAGPDGAFGTEDDIASFRP